MCGQTIKDMINAAIDAISQSMEALLILIFVGCLVMSLAETLQALPVFSRRIHLAVGFQYVILSIALGKLMGSLIYFVTGIGERIGVG